jgi:hypothetical protein
MTAFFIVRAQVVDPSARDPFDRWYEDDHLPDAVRTFKAKRGWRGWSDLEPNVHYAFYEFADMASAKAIQGTEGLKRLVADFDRTWGNRVTRTRDFVQIVQAA